MEIPESPLTRVSTIIMVVLGIALIAAFLTPVMQLILEASLDIPADISYVSTLLKVMPLLLIVIGILYFLRWAGMNIME